MTINSYWSQIIILPKKIVNEIEAICRAFLWKGQNALNGSGLIALEFVGQAKSEGGIGFKKGRLRTKERLHRFRIIDDPRASKGLKNAAPNHHVHGDRPTYEDVRSPYYPSIADHPGLALVTLVLTDRNFQPSTRDFKFSIGSRKKIYFLDGTLPKPPLNDPLYSSWIRCNQMVQSWILHSVSPEIKSGIMYLDTAADMWTELNNRFNQGNGPQIFKLNENFTFLHQDDDSMNTYFTKLTVIWDEITQLRPKIPCTCVTAARNQEYHNHDQVLQFLKGLSDSYHVVRDQVLLLDPLSSSEQSVFYDCSSRTSKNYWQ
uniref:Retrotransposon Copia-like N-terminal domain-containing protein n=1 Tax=Cannabis sativa TaxID=3483 RepID=A0A803PJM5_CANSA